MGKLCAYRADGKVTVETSPGAKPFQQWTLTDAEARNLAAQLLAAMVDDEHMSTFQAAQDLGRKSADFFAQLKRITGR